MKSTLLALCCLVLFSTGALADDVSGKLELRRTLEDVGLVGSWIYDDLERGVAEAKAKKKPLFVVFRCVP